MTDEDIRREFVYVRWYVMMLAIVLIDPPWQKMLMWLLLATGLGFVEMVARQWWKLKHDSRANKTGM